LAAPDEFGGWGESSELGYTGFEVRHGAAEEQTLFDDLTQIEVLRNKLMFERLRNAPTADQAN
tara:strand:+ start:66020 stop:66208 length:189 start_codon:yes stop_codon:yes gene_type:complete